MFGLSLGHMVLLGVVVLVFVGPEQLPEVARNIARLLNELRRATGELRGKFTEGIELPRVWDDPRSPPANSIAAAPAPAPVHAETPTSETKPT